MKYVRLYVTAAFADMVAASIIYVWLSSWRCYLMEEDSLVENLTALLFLAAGILGLFLLPRIKDRRTLAFTAVVSALGRLCFLDEISFGERVFNFSMPVLAGVKIDAVHDVFQLTRKAIMRTAREHEVLPYLLVAGTGVMCTILIAAAYGYRQEVAGALTAIFKHPPAILFLISTLLVLVSIVIDMEVIDFDALFITEASLDLNALERSLTGKSESAVFMLEEMFELNAALALLFSCANLRKLAASGELARP